MSFLGPTTGPTFRRRPAYAFLSFVADGDFSMSVYWDHFASSFLNLAQLECVLVRQGIGWEGRTADWGWGAERRWKEARESEGWLPLGLLGGVGLVVLWFR